MHVIGTSEKCSVYVSAFSCSRQQTSVYVTACFVNYTFDLQVTDKFMDLSIEKTNSAYMLFYEKVSVNDEESVAGPSSETEVAAGPNREIASTISSGNREEEKGTFDLSQSLEEWIWQDNKNFIQDNNIFDHTYFK
jgi:ubiquitin carboxyl-terminal hydrolase 34